MDEETALCRFSLLNISESPRLLLPYLNVFPRAAELSELSQNVVKARQTFTGPLATLQLLHSDAGDDEGDLTDRPRQTGFTCGITLSQSAALPQERETDKEMEGEREREQGIAMG